MAKHPKNFSRKTHASSNPPHTHIRFNCPAVSVIIPLYNVEKYIGECLDSLLAQSFQNFEVIVVDDCSTDSSPAIVESYAPKFDGRLILLHMKKNSGGAGFPRNKGIEFARGDYIYFIDPDDTITLTALEELYSLAKEYDADVVHCEKYYDVPDKLWDNAEYRRQLKPSTYLTGKKIFIHKPCVWENDFEERIKFFISKKLIWNYWVQLVRRDFIIKNSIKAVGIMADDMIFTICELCCAKRYVVVPNVIYLYRQREDSLIHKKFVVQKNLILWITMLKNGIRYLDKFLNDNEFFAQRPDLKYTLFDMFVSEMTNHLLGIYARVPAPALDELLRKEFSGGDNVALTSFIFSAMNIHRLQLMQTQQRIAALEDELKRLKG